MKQSLAYTLLLIMCFQAGGFLLVFKVRQWGINDEMDKSHKGIETLEIPLHYYNAFKEREGREIRWQGKMYDIKSIEVRGETAIIKAIDDKKEKQLITKFSNVVNNNEGSGKLVLNLSKLLTLELFSNSGGNFFLNYIGTLVSPGNILRALDGFPGIQLQPPRAV